MKKAVIQLETLTCPSCAQKIESGVKSLEGVEKESVSVLFNASKVKLNFDDSRLSAEEIEKTIRSFGYDILKSQVKDL